MDFWREVENLEGQELRTLDQGNPFDIVAVTQRTVIIQPHATSIERNIARKEIEGDFQELVTRGEITRADIHSRHSEFNPAYVAAILAALPGVQHTTRPIRLQYKR